MFLAIFLSFIFHQTDYAVKGFIIAVPGILAACFLIWLFRRPDLTGEIKVKEYVPFQSFDHKNFNLFLVFIIVYLFSIISLFVTTYRPWYYFVLAAALFSLIFFQIIRNNSTFLIITEILLTSLNLIYGVTLKYPLYFGATDTMAHLYLSKVTLLSGHIISPEIDFSYANYPLYHIFIAISQIFTGLPLNVSYFLIIAIPFIFVVFFLYKIFFILSENTIVSLSACLLYATSSVIVEYSQYVVTRVFAYIGFIILIYSFYKIVNCPLRQRTGINCIIILDSLFLVLVHQVTLYQIIFLLLVLFVIEQIIEEKKIVDPKKVVFLFALFIGYQVFSQGTFFSTVIRTRFNILINENIATVRSSIQNINPYDFLISHLDLAIIAFFIFIGIGYVIWTYKSRRISAIGLFALLNLVFFLPNPLVMSTIVTVYFRADRLTLLIAPFMAFIAAIGLCVVLNRLIGKQINRNYLISLFLTIIFIFSFASLALPFASDSKDFWWYHVRDDYFTTGESQSFEFVNQNIPFGSDLYSDNAASLFFKSVSTRQTEGADLPYFTSRILKSVDLKTKKTGYTLLRKDEFQNNGLELDTPTIGEWDKFQPTGENIRYMNYFTSSGNVIFDSREMKITYA